MFEERAEIAPEIAEIIEQLVQAQARLDRFTYKLSERRWGLRPGARQWSAGECVEHLNITSRAFLPRLREAVIAAPVLPGRHRYQMDRKGRMIAALTGPMPRFWRWRFGRVRTPPAFVPATVPPMRKALGEFELLQREILRVVRAADGRGIDTVMITSPFDPRISYSAYSAMVMIPRHQHRHLEQAERAIAIEVPSRVRGFRQDQTGRWVAELDCGHLQRMDERSLWKIEPVTATEQGRAKLIGRVVACETCHHERGMPR